MVVLVISSGLFFKPADPMPCASLLSPVASVISFELPEICFPFISVPVRGGLNGVLSGNAAIHDPF